MDGLDVIRNSARMERSAIIVLSARGQEQIRYGTGLGADDYLTKPFGVPECSPA